MEHRNEDMICKKILTSDNCTDISFEYILPDYFPDIRKSIHVFPSVRLTEAYVSNDRVQYSMTVSFGFMYRAEDKTLQCAECKHECSDHISIKNQNAVSADIIPTLQNVNIRVANPRKIVFKARICADICVWGQESFAPEINGNILSENEKQVLSVPVQSADVTVIEDSAISVSQDIAIPSEYPEADRIITVYALPQITQTESEDGSISFGANITGIIVYSTVSDESGESGVAFLPISIPVTRTVVQEGVSSDCVCNARMSVYGITGNISENAEGEKRVIEIDLLYDLRILCMCNQQAEAIADMYSTSHESNTSSKNISTETAKGAYRSSFTVSGDLTQEDCEQLNGDIISAFAKESDITFSESGKRLTLQGTLDICCICQQGDELDSQTFKLPFKGDMELPDIEMRTVYPEVSVGCANVNYDGEKYYFTCEIYVNALVTENRSYTVLESISVTENVLQTSAAPFTLYYPSENEGAWQIAKKYGISPEELKKANPSLETKRVIVIPKKA